MIVAVIGSGGREHALAQRIKLSGSVEKLYIIPGNPGTSLLGENVQVNTEDKEAVITFCREQGVDLVVIGPEIPLVDGLSDYLRAAGLPVFGPSAAAAEIEGNKSFAKSLMQKYSIPTADFKIYYKETEDEAVSYLKNCSYPVVIKASGLAAGKGVLICENQDAALSALRECFDDQVFGAAGNTVVIEEFMYGQEASVFAVTDGEDFICLPAAQDHKRIGDLDTGKNTGGMGAYAPAPVVTDEIMKETEEKIIKPTLAAMKKEGRTFTGCLYCGLMLTNEGVRVVEFNCRFGDPETQAVLPLLEGDFAKLLLSSATGKLDKNSVRYNGGAAVCVVLASGGYPDKFEKGFEISGLDAAQQDGIFVYHAGTKFDGEKVVTSGGRVLGVTAVTDENDLKLCKSKAYEALGKISYNNMYFRRDIADKAIK